ncbi:MAG TPA: hypothetical protein VKP30_13425, partial [Polyangiaceae bacterium]|nr:hypothetical protein [Polyangiaceae bacterium]
MERDDKPRSSNPRKRIGGKFHVIDAGGRDGATDTSDAYRGLPRVRRIRWLPLLLTVGVTALGCQPPSRSLEHAPIEVLVSTEPATLDPRYATRSLDVKLSRLLHAGLVSLDPDTLLPKPDIALSLKRSNGLDIVIELDPSVRFHSGKPLDSNDVCATI